MMDFIKYVSMAFTALSLAFTGWLQYEKFRLDGEWHIDTCTEETDFRNYEGLHLAWRVFLSDDPLSAPVVGDGEKVEEAFATIPSAARYPVRLVGTKEINSVSLTGRFEGAKRASTGRFEFHPTLSKRLFSGYIPFYQRNADVLEGTFAFTAGNARGPARAVRLVDGKIPDGVAPFACMGITAKDIEEIAEAPPPAPAEPPAEE
ncbi:MAG: hypothetical protein R3C13_01185 [Hyphomonas sp.]|uniref:hypothetical protein n=1 Tax=Hyphomonas sp. TaxID=87 RepID=UPI0035285F2B